MKLFGWTIEQWALAGFWYLDEVTALPLPGLEGARQVHHCWRLAHAYAPGESPLMLPWQRRPPLPEWTWAAQLMYAVAMEVGPCVGR